MSACGRWAHDGATLMAPKPAGPSGRDIRELGRRLADAPDAEVARAVAVVDQLSRRGGADQLIEPLRPRLPRLRPPRPLHFTRLLFLPLDPLIAPPLRWQPHLPNIPRTALGPLAATVRAGLGAEAAAIDAAIRGVFSHHVEAVIRAGDQLWPRAAALLSAAPPPVGWAETGLGVAVYEMLARRIGAVLAQAPLVQELVAEAEAGIALPRLTVVQAMLGDVGARCPDALTMLVTVLLARLPQLAPILVKVAPELGPRGEALLRQAGQEATETLLAGLESRGGMEIAVTRSDLADTAQEVRRTVQLLEQLAERPDIPHARARVQAIRHRLDIGCRSRFAQGVSTEFLPSLRQSAPGSARPAKALEATARHLRELESEARLLGGSDDYDAQLRDAAAAVRAVGASMSLAGRVRLVEILAGPDAALALLAEGGASEAPR